MSADEIKAHLRERWGESPAAQLSFRILDFLAGLPEEHRRMLTFRTLCQAVEREEVDDELLTAITMLVSSRIPALDARALLVDDDEREHEISPEELAEARKAGELIHPETGERVIDFESKVIPFFVPSAHLLSARR